MTDKSLRQKRKEAMEQANNQCPKCGAVHGQTVRTSERTGNLWVAYLQLAHPDHNPWDPNARVEISCNGCHMSGDGPLHAANAKKSRERQKNGGRSYQRNSVSNHDLVRIASTLGIELVYEADEAGGCWHWSSEISIGSHPEMAYAISQALYDLMATYRELAHQYAPPEEFYQDKMAALCTAGGGEHETTGG